MFLRKQCSGGRNPAPNSERFSRRVARKASISVRRNLFELSNHNVAASIFLAKNLLGYKNVVECIGEDGTPIRIERVNIKRLTDEELAEYERLLKKATDSQSDEG